MIKPILGRYYIIDWGQSYMGDENWFNATKEILNKYKNRKKWDWDRSLGPTEKETPSSVYQCIAKLHIPYVNGKTDNGDLYAFKLLGKNYITFTAFAVKEFIVRKIWK